MNVSLCNFLRSEINVCVCVCVSICALCLSVCLCASLLESVFLFLTKHTLISFSVWNPRKLLLVDVKQRWMSHFQHF